MEQSRMESEKRATMRRDDDNGKTKCADIRPGTDREQQENDE